METVKIKILRAPMMKRGHSFEFKRFKTEKIPPEEPESKPSPIKHQQIDCKMKPAKDMKTEANLKKKLLDLVVAE